MRLQATTVSRPPSALAAGLPLAYSTYFGGEASDVVTAVAADSRGNLYLTGYTNSAEWPPSERSLA